MNREKFFEVFMASERVGLRSAIERCHEEEKFFPTEQFGKIADCMRKNLPYDCERVGWFDLPKAREIYKEEDYLVLRDIDTLGKVGLELGYINFCTMYNYKGTYIKEYSEEICSYEGIKPVYLKLKGGWDTSYLHGEYEFSELPHNAQSFVRIVEVFTGKPVVLV